MIKRNIKINLGTKKYNKTLKELAYIMNDSYSLKNNRKSSYTVNNNKFIYNKTKSTNLYSHYENKDIIIVGFHGVKNFNELGIGIKRIIKPKYQSDLFKSACIKYKKVMSENPKKVIFLGHSLGTQMISWCYQKNKKLGIPHAVLFSPYIFNLRSKINKNIIQIDKWKKILVDTDWIGNKIIRAKKTRKNTIIFKTPIGIVSTFSGHPMNNYLNEKLIKRKQYN